MTTGPHDTAYQIPDITLGDTFNEWRNTTNDGVIDKLNRMKVYTGTSGDGISVGMKSDGETVIEHSGHVIKGVTFDGNVTFNGAYTVVNANEFSIDDFTIMLGATGLNSGLSGGTGQEDSYINTIGGGGLNIVRTDGATVNLLWKPHMYGGTQGTKGTTGTWYVEGPNVGLTNDAWFISEDETFRFHTNKKQTPNNAIGIIVGPDSANARNESRISIQSTAGNVYPVLQVGTRGAISGATNEGFAKLINGSVARRVSKTAHGFSFGSVVRFDGTVGPGSNGWTLGLANTEAGAEAVGIISYVAGNTFDVTYTGEVIGDFRDINEEIGEDGKGKTLAPGNVYFLSTSAHGKITSVQPTSANHINKPVLVALDTLGPNTGATGDRAVVVNYRGALIPDAAADITEQVQNRILITQANDFVVGDLVRFEKDVNYGWSGDNAGVTATNYYGNGVWLRGQANSNEEAEVLGVVTTVSVAGDRDKFYITLNGKLDFAGGRAEELGITAGRVYFLSANSAPDGRGGLGLSGESLTTIPPLTDGHVKKPFAVSISGTELIILNYVGEVIGQGAGGGGGGGGGGDGVTTGITASNIVHFTEGVRDAMDGSVGYASTSAISLTTANEIDVHSITSPGLGITTGATSLILQTWREDDATASSITYLPTDGIRDLHSGAIVKRGQGVSNLVHLSTGAVNSGNGHPQDSGYRAFRKGSWTLWPWNFEVNQGFGSSDTVRGWWNAFDVLALDSINTGDITHVILNVTNITLDDVGATGRLMVGPTTAWEGTYKYKEAANGRVTVPVDSDGIVWFVTDGYVNDTGGFSKIQCVVEGYVRSGSSTTVGHLEYTSADGRVYPLSRTLPTSSVSETIVPIGTGDVGVVTLPKVSVSSDWTASTSADVRVAISGYVADVNIASVKEFGGGGGSKVVDAGRNLLINGNFDYWQRMHSSENNSSTHQAGRSADRFNQVTSDIGGAYPNHNTTTSTSQRFFADRWGLWNYGANWNNASTNGGVSRHRFSLSDTSGASGSLDPKTSKPANYYLRITSNLGGAGNPSPGLEQRIEGVDKIYNDKATVSFWARRSDGTATTLSGVVLTLASHASGTGDYVSTSAAGAGGAGYNFQMYPKIKSPSLPLNSSWTKYVYTFDVPNIAGVSAGIASSGFGATDWPESGGGAIPGQGWMSLTLNPVPSAYADDGDYDPGWSGNFDIAQVQFERGSGETEFDSRDLNDELKRCERYYQQSFGPFGSTSGTNTLNGDTTTDNTQGGVIYTDRSISAYMQGGHQFKSVMRHSPRVQIFTPDGEEGSINGPDESIDWGRQSATPNLGAGTGLLLTDAVTPSGFGRVLFNTTGDDVGYGAPAEGVLWSATTDSRYEDNHTKGNFIFHYVAEAEI